VFRSAGDTVLGADDKAGIAEIIEALCVLRDQDIPHGPIEVVISVCEEKGLLGAKQLDLKRLHATRGIALDTCGVDSVTARAPGANRLRVEIEGIESHAGIAPERGISAIQVAARAIERMPLGRIDADTVANIGRIDGGVADNIVAKKVTLTGEARSHHPDKLRRQTEAMLAACTQAAEDLAGVIDGVRRTATITSRVHADYPLMHIDEDAPVLRLIRDASAALGAPCTVLTGGGGSDANIFTAGGIPTVILGSGMTDVHSIHESVSVADLVRVSRLLVEVLQRAW